jgi:hypothetical protein
MLVRCIGICLLASLALGTLQLPGSGADRRKGKKNYSKADVRERQQQAAIKAATAQLNAAKQVLAAAESKGSGAQAKLDASIARLRDAADTFRDAQSTSRHLARELAEIEQEILEEQSADSPYAKARLALEAARKKQAEVEERIVSESDVQKQLLHLSGVKLVDARTAILERRAEYLTAKAAVEAEADTVAKIRSQLFQGDSHWREAAEALKAARLEEGEAESMTHAGASGRVGAQSTVKDAAEATATARRAIAQAEAVIKANSDGKDNKKGSKGQPDRKGKNKK